MKHRTCSSLRSLRVVLCVGIVGLAGHTSAKSTPVSYCSGDVAGERASALALQKWLENVQLVLRDVKNCKGENIELRVVRHTGRVKLVLRARGRELSRLVPWLARDDGALARLAVAGRLSELSVMITALLAESKQRRRARRSPATSRSKGKRTYSASVSRPRVGPTRAPAKAAITSARVAPVTSSPASRTPAPSIAPSVTPSPTASPIVPRVEPAPPVTSPPKVETAAKMEERDEPGAPINKPKTRRSDREEIPGELKASTSRSRRSSSRWYDHLAVAAFTAGRYRASDIWSAEFGGAVRWRSLFFRAGYQLPANWMLQGRAMDVSAVPLALGWQPRLLDVGPVRLRALVAVAVERLAVRRLDLTDATTHSCWDFGGLAGAIASLRIAGGLELALQIEASWMPAGREVEVPQGPTAVLSRFGVQSALVLWWGPENG